MQGLVLLLIPVPLHQLLDGRPGGIRQIQDTSALPFLIRFEVERVIVTGHPPFHLQHLGLGDTQIVRHGGALLTAHPAGMAAAGTEVEEQLALRLGSGHLDNTPVAQDEFVNLRLDPMHCKGDQTYAMIRVVALHRLHQADIAFLNQVGFLQAISPITPRHPHHEAQVAEHQILGRIHVAMIAQAPGQITFFFRPQQRLGVHKTQVPRQPVGADQISTGYRKFLHGNPHAPSCVLGLRTRPHVPSGGF